MSKEIILPNTEVKRSKKTERKVERKKNSDKKSSKNHKAKKKFSKKKIALLVFAIGLPVAACITAAILIFIVPKSEEPKNETVSESVEPEVPTIFYSKLSGKEITRSGPQENGLSYTVEEAKMLAEEYNSAPTYCIQIPNGGDYNRIQAGFDNAAIVFEAIAEAGITRFDMIVQNPTGAAIGPIRSLRMYYLEWDVPFDCTIVHAGGERQAKEKAANGNYRDLTESLTYMWRSNYGEYYAPNNLFTDATRLKNFNKNHKYETSNYKTFTRQSYDDAKKQIQAIENSKNTKTDEEPSDEMITLSDAGLPKNAKSATKINVRFGSVPGYNPVYTYNAKTNTYLRSYESGEKHTYRVCNTAKDQPRLNTCGKEIQVEASAIAVMEVEEHTLPNGRENTKTIGSGKAYIFQNGAYIPATWKKESESSQIEFRDQDGNYINISPGQFWISAIPKSVGSVKYE